MDYAIRMTPRQDSPFGTVSEAVDGFGGTSALARRLNEDPRIVSNWKRHNRFPAYRYLVLKAVFAERELTIEDDLFGLHVPEAKE